MINWLLNHIEEYSGKQVNVLKHLPLWKVLGTTTSSSDIRPGESSRPHTTGPRFLQSLIPNLKNKASVPPGTRSCIISAVNALLVPKELVIPNILPIGLFISVKEEFSLARLKLLGAKEVDSADYILTHLLPTIQANPNAPGLSGGLIMILDFAITASGKKGTKGVQWDEFIRKHIIPIVATISIKDQNRNQALHNIFKFISSDKNLLETQLAKGPLIPNRNGQLCRATELFDPSEKIFTECFYAEDSKFPQDDFKIGDLKSLGIQTAVTPRIFTECLEYFERDFQAGSQPNLLLNRARKIWLRFCEGLDSKWTSKDMRAIAKYHFVPISQYKSGTSSYRDTIPLPRVETVFLATLIEVIEPQYMAIGWTQAFLPEQHPSLWITQLFSFIPSVEQVVRHLVQLATVVAPKCTLNNSQFFCDLEATYNHLNKAQICERAGAILKERYPDENVFLNIPASLERMSRDRITLGDPRTGLGKISSPVDSLLWLPAKRAVQGLPYDEHRCRIYPPKESLEPYGGLLRASGMNILRHVDAYPTTVEGSSGSHGDNILQMLRQMKGAEDQCDLTITVQGRSFYVHRMILACFSSYFLRLVGPKTWKESRTGVVNMESTPFATTDSVAAVVDWVYRGSLDIRDNVADLDTDTASMRLNHYMDVLQLTDYWDIPMLKKQMESLILRDAFYFIRVENVRALRSIAEQCNAAEVRTHCERLEDSNKEIVDMINSMPEEVEETRKGTIARLKEVLIRILTKRKH